MCRDISFQQTEIFDSFLFGLLFPFLTEPKFIILSIVVVYTESYEVSIYVPTLRNIPVTSHAMHSDTSLACGTPFCCLIPVLNCSSKINL